jgi:uncharacterized protein YdeI (YjbR/CyaY-like superfamily)
MSTRKTIAKSVGPRAGAKRAAGTRAPVARHPGIDAYIAKSAPFAQPILRHLRALVHEACPDVEESLKWGAPNFGYHGMLCGMAAFKAHATFGFWKGTLVLGEGAGRSADAMWDFGRITSLKDLPSDATIRRYVKRAMALNEQGVQVKRPPKHAARTRQLDSVPDDLATALRRNADARRTFESFPPSQRREYVEWLLDAKREETRERRLATTIEWLSEGKTRHWKYK